MVTSDSFTFTDDFTGFDGSADPTNWTTENVASTSAWQGTGTGTSTTGGKYSFGDTGSGPTFEGSLGFLPSSSRAINAIIEFELDTDVSLTGFTLEYTAEHWRSALDGRNNGWAVSYSLNGGADVALADLTYVAPNNLPTGGGPHGSENLSADVSGSFVAGDVLTFTFFGDNGTGGGARQGVAIDNLTFTAIPEPSTFLLVALAGTAAVIFRRRRRTA